MNEAELIAALPSLVRAGWGRFVGATASTDAGMNSTTARAEVEGESFVAKWVTASSGPALDAGSAIALRVAATGVGCGEPLLTTDGALSLTTPDGGRLALLRYVYGRSLTGSADDQALIAETLARVHTCGGGVRAPTEFMTDLVDLVHDVEPWVRPAVLSVIDEHRDLPPVRWGVLHADPAPDAFRYDASTGQAGLIDWSAGTDGPVLYDVASAVMYLGGPTKAGPFLNAYADVAPGGAAEVDAHLDSFSRFRAAVQAAYFSMRVAAADLTGIEDQAENWKGLRDGQRMLAAYGVGSG